MALEYTQPLTEMSSRNLPEVKNGRGVRLIITVMCLHGITETVRNKLPPSFCVRIMVFWDMQYGQEKERRFGGTYLLYIQCQRVNRARFRLKETSS
jgi:hypothetical protein